jgi:hypothetical protein
MLFISFFQHNVFADFNACHSVRQHHSDMKLRPFPSRREDGHISHSRIPNSVSRDINKWPWLPSPHPITLPSLTIWQPPLKVKPTIPVATPTMASDLKLLTSFASSPDGILRPRWHHLDIPNGITVIHDLLTPHDTTLLIRGADHAFTTLPSSKPPPTSTINSSETKSHCSGGETVWSDCLADYLWRVRHLKRFTPRCIKYIDNITSNNNELCSVGVSPTFTIHRWSGDGIGNDMISLESMSGISERRVGHENHHGLCRVVIWLHDPTNQPITGSTPSSLCITPLDGAKSSVRVNQFDIKTGAAIMYSPLSTKASIMKKGTPGYVIIADILYAAPLLSSSSITSSLASHLSVSVSSMNSEWFFDWSLPCHELSPDAGNYHDYHYIDDHTNHELSLLPSYVMIHHERVRIYQLGLMHTSQAYRGQRNETWQTAFASIIPLFINMEATGSAPSSLSPSLCGAERTLYAMIILNRLTHCVNTLAATRSSSSSSLLQRKNGWRRFINVTMIAFKFIDSCATDMLHGISQRPHVDWVVSPYFYHSHLTPIHELLAVYFRRS